jgi:predicted HAD superfamily Cof-like phosphohydrolase
MSRIALQGGPFGCVLHDQVKQFHETMGQPIGSTPQIPTDDRVRLRLRLIAEEFFEALEACGIRLAEVYPDDESVKGVVLQYIDEWRSDPHPLETEVVDLPAFADALGDLDYVIEGARIEFGIDGAPIADAIHKSNMEKATPCTCQTPPLRRPSSGPCHLCGGTGRVVKKREDGKTMKPKGWTPPDIAGELEKQGWVKP